MNDFIAYNPVMLHFGRNCTDLLGKTVSEYGKKALLMYGKGSVKRFGYFDLIAKQLKQHGIAMVEYGGIKPNPVATQADEAIAAGRKEKVDFIIALGGGSVIDTAKYVALGIKENIKAWEIASGKRQATQAMPIIAVLTVAATGTEMNQFAVIQNEDTQEKVGYGSPMMFPKHSFLDPQFTYSLPPNHTAYGVVDLMAHAFENFFGAGDAPVTDKITAVIVKEAMDYGVKVLEEPENYEYRANIMQLATLALNGTTAWGKTVGDWGVHSIGHNLSVLYDMPHGATLSIAYLAWFRHISKTKPERIARLSELITGKSDVEAFIHKTEDFFKEINAPVRLADLQIGQEQRDTIIELMKANKVSGTNYQLTDSDYSAITDLMYAGK